MISQTLEKILCSLPSFLAKEIHQLCLIHKVRLASQVLVACALCQVVLVLLHYQFACLTLPL